MSYTIYSSFKSKMATENQTQEEGLLTKLDQLYLTIDTLSEQELDKLTRYIEEQKLLLNISINRRSKLTNELRIERIKMRKELNAAAKAAAPREWLMIRERQEEEEDRHDLAKHLSTKPVPRVKKTPLKSKKEILAETSSLSDEDEEETVISKPKEKRSFGKNYGKEFCRSAQK